MVRASQLLVRADANTQIGSGHVMRCLALAQAWQEHGGKVAFVCSNDLPETLHTRLSDEGMSVILLNAVPGSQSDARETIATEQSRDADIIVIDGYQFGADYQRWIKDAGFRLLFIDDNGHAEHYYADWVLNQNIHADESLYSNREPYTELLLGTRYVLLRREFWAWRDWQRDIPDVAHNILVTMGGSDPDNVTLKVLKAIAQLPEALSVAVKVIVGGSNPHLANLSEYVSTTETPIELLHNISDMPTVMAWADVAVSAAGSTSWEMSFMRLPRLVIAVADNQLGIAEMLSAKDAAISLGWHEDVSVNEISVALLSLLGSCEQRVEMSHVNQGLVDGKGGQRILAATQELTLRSAQPEDCRLVWEWANDPVTRKASFSSEPIPWEVHTKWYKRKSQDTDVLFLIAYSLEQPVGQVRFDRYAHNEALVSVSVAAEHRGMGYSSRIIQQGTQRALQILNVDKVHAYIKPENVASLKSFAHAGYRDIGTDLHQNQTATHYVYERSYAQD